MLNKKLLRVVSMIIIVKRISESENNKVHMQILDHKDH